MKTYTVIVSLLFVALVARAQDLIPFSHIEALHIKGNLEVVLTPGEQTGVIIEAGEDRKVKLIQEGDRLTVRHADLFRYKSYREFPVRVEVIYKDLEELSIAAGAHVSAEQSIRNLRVDVKLRSGARAKLELQTDKSDLDVGEGAMGTFTGHVRQLTGVAATGGQLNAEELISDRCKMRANTGGCARIQAREYLDAAAHTGGAIYYSGKPTELLLRDELGGTVANKG